MKKHLLSIISLFIITSSLCQAQNPTLWGMTQLRKLSFDGTIFRTTDSGIETDLHDFDSIDGQYANGSLIRAGNGLLYGMTLLGGIYDKGTIFSYDISTGIETKLHDFGSGTDGYYPYGSLVQASNGLLYGLTCYGGTIRSDAGTIFSYDISTGIETDLYNFGTYLDGATPTGSLIQLSNGLLYGMTAGGGFYNSANGGIIFSYNISSGTETDIHDFGGSTDGVGPRGSLIQAGNGLLYGMTSQGGTNSGGIIFSYDTTTGIETDIHDFGGLNDGESPYGTLIQANNSLLYGMTYYGNGGIGTIFNYNISTGIETVLHDFGGGTDGSEPYGSLIQASNFLLYGMTIAGGVNNSGIILSYNISTGVETDIHDFTPTNGHYPYGDLLEVDIVYATPLQANFCEGGNATLTANGATTYTWAPATGLNTTIGDTVIASPTATTTYTITGTAGSIVSTTTVTVTVTPDPIIITNSFPASYCSGGSSTLTASGGTSYSWTPSTGLSATTGDSLIANPTVTTIFSVTGIDISGCTSTVKDTVKVIPVPLLTIQPQSPSVCAGQTITLSVPVTGSGYSWSPSFTLSSSTGDSVVANPTATIIYSVTGKNSGGCTSTGVDTVKIVSVPPLIIQPTSASICSGQNITLSVPVTGSGYSWSPSSTLSSSTGDSVVANPTATITYSVTGKNSGGCTSTGTDTVKVSSLLALTILPESPSVCDGQSVILKASGGTTYLWVGTTNTTNTITVNPSKDTAYELIVSNGGCSKDTLIRVNVINAPPITILPQGPVFCSGLSVTLSILGGGSGFVWNPSTGLSTTTGDSVVASPTISTTYTVTGNDSLGCASTGTDIVTVIPSPNKPTFMQHGDTLISSSKNDNQWYRNDTLLINDTSQRLIITALGEYWVNVINEANGCSTSSDSITGINQLLVINNQLSMYPNPTSGQFTISLQSNQNGYSLEVYDILGKEIYKSVLYSSQDIINLSAQPSGMYFVYLKSEEGVEIGKILITK